VDDEGLIPNPETSTMVPTATDGERITLSGVSRQLRRRTARVIKLTKQGDNPI
jgi:hypothetical protein